MIFNVIHTLQCNEEHREYSVVMRLIYYILTHHHHESMIIGARSSLSIKDHRKLLVLHALAYTIRGLIPRQPSTCTSD